MFFFRLDLCWGFWINRPKLALVSHKADIKYIFARGIFLSGVGEGRNLYFSQIKYFFVAEVNLKSKSENYGILFETAMYILVEKPSIWKVTISPKGKQTVQRPGV